MPAQPGTQADDAGEQVLKLGFRFLLSRFVDGMECEVAIDDRIFRAPVHGRRLLEINGQIVLGRKGLVKIVSPFEMEVGNAAVPIPEPVAPVSHPISRAILWETELARGMSVRALALKEDVSASLISTHMKLLRLAPEIQEFARNLSTPAEVRFFSLRKLATLAALNREDQLWRMKIWQQRFGSQTAPNPPGP